jgi:DNA helicase HerA-like ATPase
LINLSSIRPSHLKGALELSDPQKQIMNLFHKDYHESWIEAIVSEKPLRSIKGELVPESTINTLRRKLQNLLNVSYKDNKIISSGIFSIVGGESTISDIVGKLSGGNTVVVDTSSVSGQVEILVGSIIASDIFYRYKDYKNSGKLSEMPNVSVVLEEAPRVIGKDIIERGTNIFETLAREGRKFKVGLFAITQLPSLIPKPILANLNTKIILGLEMNVERSAVIESASHDLSRDSKTIAALDKGEAIVSSTFLKFAVPLKIEKFHDLVTRIKSEYNKDKLNKQEHLDKNTVYTL